MSTPLNMALCVHRDARTAWIRIACEQDSFSYDFSDVYALGLVYEPFFTRPTKGKAKVKPEGALEEALAAALEDVKPDTRATYERLDDLARGGGHFRDAAGFAARFVRARGYRDFVGPRLPARFEPGADGLYRPTTWWTSDEERFDERERMDQEYQDLLDEGSRDGEPPVSATLVLEATDAAWFEHLEAGLAWNSYAYDAEADALP